MISCLIKESIAHTPPSHETMGKRNFLEEPKLKFPKIVSKTGPTSKEVVCYFKDILIFDHFQAKR
jgi:hypothetical protein